MQLKKKFVFVFLVLSFLITKAQLFTSSIAEDLQDDITLGTGISYLSFMGDIGGQRRYNEMFYSVEPGAILHAEMKFTKSLAFSNTFEFGKLSSKDRDRSRELEFKSNIFHYAWHMKYIMENSRVMDRSAFSANFSLGMGVVFFNPKDKNGKLLDNDNNFEKFALTIPLFFGIKYAISDNLYIHYSLGFVISNSDHIDLYTRQDNLVDFFSGHKDAFFSSTLGIEYLFARNPWGSSKSGFTCMERYFSSNWNFLHFSGDIRHQFNLRNNAFSFAFEQRFSNYVGLAAEALFGKITVIGKSPQQLAENNDFQSTISNWSFSTLIYLDNGAIISRNSSYSPFINIGAGYLTFNPRGDLKSHWGYDYYFWDDGRIMNAPQGTANAKEVVRDGYFETNLDPLKQNPKNCFTLHCGLGLRIKLTSSISAKYRFLYFFTNTDFIDNLSNSPNSSPKFFSKQNDAIYSNTFGIDIDLRTTLCKKRRFRR